MSKFNFEEIRLADIADITVVDSNFKKIEDKALTSSDIAEQIIARPELIETIIREIEVAFEQATTESTGMVQLTSSVEGQSEELALTQLAGYNLNKKITGITPSEIGAAKPAILVHTTLSASWPGGAQIISNENILSNSPGDVFISNTANDEQFQAFNNAQLHLTAQVNGNITLTVRGVIPIIPIPIILEIRS